MKKILFLFFCFVLILLPLALFAQDPEPPAGWLDVISNPGKWFVSFNAVALLTAFLAASVNGILKVTKNWMKQAIAWLVGILLVVGSDVINFGYAKELPILLAIFHGTAAGFASNGWFDIPFMKSILDAIEKFFNKDA